MKQQLHDKACALWRGIIWLNNIVCAIVAPPICLSCKKFLSGQQVLCLPCGQSIRPISSYALSITKQYAVTVFGVSGYEGIVQQLIRAKQARKMYAAHALGLLIWDYTDLRFQEFDYIVPVPLHWRRYAARGYNQAEEIARALRTRSGKPILNCLYRSRATAIQASLSAQERVLNVQDAFVMKKNYQKNVYGARILLIDDVLTTGSTLEACVRTLRTERPLSIIIAVGSRVV